MNAARIWTVPAANSAKLVGSGRVRQRLQCRPHEKNLGVRNGSALSVPYMPFDSSGGRRLGDGSGGNSAQTQEQSTDERDQAGGERTAE